MSLMIRNQDYLLQYIDPKTGYGLLYSERDDLCLILNTLATALWGLPSDHINPSRESLLFAEAMNVPGAAEYLINVIEDMQKIGLFLNADKYPDRCERTKEEVNENPKLNQIYFYATMKCNARCYHCYQPTISPECEPRLETNQISKEVFLKFVENSLPLGLQHVKITGGEPLLRADLIDIIRGIRKMGLGVSLETNGFLIDEVLADALAGQNVEISISLDGGSADIHDSLRGLPGSFERATRALKLLSERGCEPKVIMSVSRKNVDQVEKTLKVAVANGCSMFKLNPINALGLAQRLKNKNILLNARELIELHKAWKDLGSKLGVRLFVDLPPSFASLKDIADGNTGICPFTNILGVLPDGSISFCGIGNSCPELIFGKIDSEDFEVQRFWRESISLILLRQCMSRELEGICGQCVFESSCKGSCRALAYGGSKSFLSPHPWCQEAFDRDAFPYFYLKSKKEGGEKKWVMQKWQRSPSHS